MSANTLSRTHTSFWREVTPMMDVVVREGNHASKRFAAPLESAVESHRRAFVNTYAEMIFGECIKRQKSPSELGKRQLDAISKAAADFMHRRRTRGRLHAGGFKSALPIDTEREESLEIAERLREFFKNSKDVQIQPPFRGCGRLSMSWGDVLSDGTLYEIKSGDRYFRASDIRQLLVYCSMNHAAFQYSICGCCIINPRLGIYVSWDIRELVLAAATIGASELFHEILYYVSSPTISK